MKMGSHLRLTTRELSKHHFPFCISVVEEDEDRTLCDIGEGHYLLIDFQENCDTPRVSRTGIGITVLSPSLLLKALLTLPIPPVNETFFFFKTPSDKEGDVLLHINDMQFILPLNKLHHARVEGRNKQTRHVQLVDQGQQLVRAPSGHPCNKTCSNFVDSSLNFILSMQVNFISSLHFHIS